MWLRRVFYYAQFWAIPVLPLWLLIARGITLDSPGWGLLVLLFAAPLLALMLVVIAGLTLARKSVRRARLVSWLDVAALTAWYAVIVVAGLVSGPLMAVIVVAATIAVFWLQVWQLFVETRRRISVAFAGYDAIPVSTH